MQNDYDHDRYNDLEYNKAVVEYNREVATYLESLAAQTTYPITKKWITGMAKQHRFYEKKHASRVARLEAGETITPPIKNEQPAEVVEMENA